MTNELLILAICAALVCLILVLRSFILNGGTAPHPYQVCIMTFGDGDPGHEPSAGHVGHVIFFRFPFLDEVLFFFAAGLLLFIPGMLCISCPWGFAVELKVNRQRLSQPGQPACCLRRIAA